MAAGERDDQAGDLQPQAGQRDDADDDAGGRGRGADAEDADRARLRSAAASRRGVSAVSRRSSSSPTASIVAQKTARNADIPATMNTAIATSDVKW